MPRPLERPQIMIAHHPGIFSIARFSGKPASTRVFTGTWLSRSCTSYPNNGNLRGKSKVAALQDKPESVLLAKQVHGIQYQRCWVFMMPRPAGRKRSGHYRTRSSAVEHHVDIVGVTGSIPVASTIPSRFATFFRHSGAPARVLDEMSRPRP